MSDDLFIRSLQGAGLVHDVDLFLARFRSGPGEFRLVIVADGADDAVSAEAMAPALRYLAREKIGVVILSGIVDPPGSAAPSFATRLGRIGAIDRSLDVDLGASWKETMPVSRGAVVSLHVVRRGRGFDAPLLVDRLDEIGCRKIVVLDAQGILFRGGQPEGIATLPPEDMAAAWMAEVDERQRVATSLARGVAAEADGRGISVSLASPINLLAELFTVRGSGTLFRPAASFVRFDTPDPERERNLCDVVERAFGRLLINRSFASLQGARAIVEAQGRAAALLIPTSFGDYMSKFAVVREAQGTGIGAELWAEILGFTDRMFWRSRNENPINNWYARVADGMIREGGWVFFWRGLRITEVDAARQFALNLPEDFQPV